MFKNSSAYLACGPHIKEYNSIFLISWIRSENFLHYIVRHIKKYLEILTRILWKNIAEASLNKGIRRRLH